MKPIYEYILNKDTKVIKNNFPQSPKISDYINFFKLNDFKELKDNPKKDNYEYTMGIFRNCWDKCYMISKQEGPLWIRFKNIGLVKSKNPVFFVFVNDNGNEERYRAANKDHVIGFVDDDQHIFTFEDYVNFRDYVKMIFNYK
jgi:hypothetical protein